MDLLNFLGQLGVQGGFGGGAAVPGFGGGMFPTGQSPMGGPDQMDIPQMPGMEGIDQALAQNKRQGDMQPQQHKGGAFRQGGTISNVLGAIGDALLVQSGHAPVYGPAQQKRRQGEALQNYLGNLDPALAEMVGNGVDLGDAVALYRMNHPGAGVAPEIIREMQAAGIDPTSAEGKALIVGHLGRGSGGGDPTFVRELEALGIDPHSSDARDLYYGRNSPAGFLLKPPARGASPASGPPPGAIDHLRANPQLAPEFDQKYGPGASAVILNGGQTVAPSGGFL